MHRSYKHICFPIGRSWKPPYVPSVPPFWNPDWSSFLPHLLVFPHPTAQTLTHSNARYSSIIVYPPGRCSPPLSRRQVVFSCLAYTANKGASVISDRVYVSSSVGALVIGICGNVYGRFSRGGSYTSAVPGLMFLVPVRKLFSLLFRSKSLFLSVSTRLTWTPSTFPAIFISDRCILSCYPRAPPRLT